MQTAVVDQPTLERMQINFSWLLKLRWAGGIGQLITILFVQFILKIDLPLTVLVTIISAQFVSNLVLEILRSHWRQTAPDAMPSDWLLGWIVSADIVVLTALLYFTGGPTNPFSIFYLVHLTLAAVVLPARWAWAVTGLTIVCYTLLLFVHVPVAALGDLSVLEPRKVPDAQLLAQQRLYFQGLYVALCTSASFIVYFIARVTRELFQREQELSRAQRLKAESDKLDALATLAAGAAHELATPLSTIAVVSRELELQLEASQADEPTVQDARLIREEVARCRVILDRMAAAAGESIGESIVWLTAEELLVYASDGLHDDGRIQLELDEETKTAKLFAPKQALGQALRALLKNALDASQPPLPVHVRAKALEAQLEIIIQDSGTGMSTEVLARAGNPFFTTKEPGQGMGLGLFLARKVVERQNGTLKIISRKDKGTQVCVTIERMLSRAPADAADLPSSAAQP